MDAARRHSTLEGHVGVPVKRKEEQDTLLNVNDKISSVSYSVGRDQCLWRYKNDVWFFHSEQN